MCARSIIRTCSASSFVRHLLCEPLAAVQHKPSSKPVLGTAPGLTREGEGGCCTQTRGCEWGPDLGQSKCKHIYWENNLRLLYPERPSTQGSQRPWAALRSFCPVGGAICLLLGQVRGAHLFGNELTEISPSVLA